MLKNLSILAALLAVLGLPFALRRPDASVSPHARQLVIVSPHNEAIRDEFERAFRAWERVRGGGEVDIDWRNIGGTTEIVRFIDSSFEARAEQPEAGIGIDLLFGGGQYDHAKQARKGQVVPCGLKARHPDWLVATILPREVAGETLYDEQDRWYGCCLSSFGICYNTDVLRDRGIGVVPREWEALGDPRLFRLVALADPTKSGSIAKAFEMLIQQQMAGEVRRRGADPLHPAPEDLAAAWRRAALLLRRVSANARYFTDSASKVPLDVAQGNAAAGMCIDFYGRFQNETVRTDEGSDRLVYVTPAEGSAVSADPIALLRGAPHRELAGQFIEFVMSPEGQKLWDYRVGTPGGPARFALRRLPIRKDLYGPEHRPHMSDPDVMPYEQVGGFVYRSEWTGRFFSLIRVLIRTMCIDTHDELVEAWRAILEAGGPDSCAPAMIPFGAMPPGAEYGAADATAARLNDKLEQVRLAREWAVFFREQYRLAARLAEQARAQRPRRRG